MRPRLGNEGLIVDTLAVAATRVVASSSSPVSLGSSRRAPASIRRIVQMALKLLLRLLFFRFDGQLIAAVGNFSGSFVKTLAVAATRVVATSSSPVDKGCCAACAPPDEPQVVRWDGWARLSILVGGGAALWGGIAWAAIRILKLG